MPKFKKEILPAGKYLTLNSKGQRTPRSFSPEQLKVISNNSNAMIAAGLKIPAPFKHLKESVPVTEELSEDAYDNAGYWDRFWMEGDTLYGEIDAPGDITDTNTPAGKLTSTVKEVSACIKDGWQDGLGRSWGPSVLHGAAVLHPVVPGQKDFELLDEAVALSMGGMMTEPTQADVAGLSKDLEAAGIYLPPETFIEDLPKVLSIALKQKNLSSHTSEPEDEEIVESRSVFMSLTGESKVKVTKKEAEALVELGALNPKTNKPLEMSDFDIGDDPRDAVNLSLSTTLLTSTKDGLKSRVEKLIETGRTTKEFAEKKIFPQIDSYKLAFAEGGGLAETPVDILIQNFEELEGKEGTTKEEINLNLDETIHKPEVDADNDVSADEITAMTNALLASV